MKYSVFTVMAPDLTPKEIIPHLKEAGYDGVEWRFKETPAEKKEEKVSFWGNNLCTLSPDITDEEINEILQLTKEHGIENAALTPYLSALDLKETERALEVAQKLGASSMRVGVPRYNRTENYHDLFEKGKRYLKEVEQMCKEYGVKGLVETHQNTIAPSAGLAYRLVQDFNPDHIGVLFDPGNMVIEGYEAHRMGMELLGSYLAHVHVKNASWKVIDKEEDGTQNWKAGWDALAKGIVDWRQFFEDLHSVGYDGYVGFEDFSGTYETTEALKKNLQLIKEINQVKESI